jgi:hypothetical protein
MLRDGAVIGEVLQVLRADDYCQDAHQRIHRAVCALHARGHPVDVVTLAQELQARGHVEDVGGYASLGELLTAAPTAANALHYAGIVRERSVRRQLHRRLASHAAAAGNGTPAGEVLEALGHDLEEVRARLGGAPGGSALREIDAADLAASPPLDLKCLPLLGRHGYVVRGWSHILAAPPKCGKTELLHASVWEWVRAGERIAYLTEEPETVWRLRLKGDSPPRGLRLIWALGASVADLMRRVTAGDETVVILDTLRNLGMLGQDECDNSQLARAVTPWVAACRPGRKTLIGVGHTRKGGGEHGEGISGGHALLAAVDVALELRRCDRGATFRTVVAYGRIIEPAELIYHRTAGGDLVPDVEAGGAPRGHGKLDTILGLLPDVPPGLTIDELRDAGLKVRKDDLLQTLQAAVAGGQVIRLGSGKRADPFTYYRPTDST